MHRETSLKVVNRHNIDSTITALALVPVVCSWVQQCVRQTTSLVIDGEFLLRGVTTYKIWNQSHSVKKILPVYAIKMKQMYPNISVSFKSNNIIVIMAF